ncbi:DUF4158 domain-containing protein [Streptomyces sp. 8P21H-1]|uniref:DUF4158 domain-containing protein n=1 Tax=Streptomyces sp. 8P21H-1 TaxID=2737048 RepID=UPI00156F2AEC|nr:DUF4158 domain-containing protein [Streptomyces sp. 8P21H-1]
MRGATRLGFAVLLKFYTQYGRFPRGRVELAGEAVEFVARQVQVPASELGFHDWTARTVEYHRAQIREHLGFRECSVADAERLTAYLADVRRGACWCIAGLLGWCVVGSLREAGCTVPAGSSGCELGVSVVR